MGPISLDLGPIGPGHTSVYGVMLVSHNKSSAKPPTQVAALRTTIENNYVKGNAQNVLIILFIIYIYIQYIIYNRRQTRVTHIQYIIFKLSL